jgi:gas vesicle protein
MKKFKKIFTIGILSFILINTVAYAADIDLYSGIIGGIVAVRDSVIKKDSGLGQNTNEAIKKLDDYVKDYKADIKNDLEAYKQSKAANAKEVVNDKVDETIQQLAREKEKLISDYKKEIDTQIESELDRELERMQKRYQYTNASLSLFFLSYFNSCNFHIFIL